jgi:hypothetical protein
MRRALDFLALDYENLLMLVFSFVMELLTGFNRIDKVSPQGRRRHAAVLESFTIDSRLRASIASKIVLRLKAASGRDRPEPGLPSSPICLSICWTTYKSGQQPVRFSPATQINSFSL